ncbi:endonuclease/exonuclease/phosphatase family protein [Actinomadura sp. SCN-SB]|uniref:endonuclease/exonuclease/phosphatase family protein n=1 Tax=Actinomadura sp. SCN-SB TaxID=3373092 RepID=UPI003753E173
MRGPSGTGARGHHGIVVTALTALPMLLSLAAVSHGRALATPAVTTASRGNGVRLRVASYNIRAGTGTDGRFDFARLTAAIRALGADVIGLQEVDVHWSARSQWRDLAGDLARATGMSVRFGPIYDLDPPAEGAPRRRYGNAILSRYPIVASCNHEITRLSTQVPDPRPEPAPGLPEVVINARGARVHVYSTHLDYRADPAVRQMQVDDTLKILAEDGRGHRSAPRVLVGDFNARPDAPELAPLWKTLNDAWTAREPSDGGMTYPATAPALRIDYIAVSRSVEVEAVHVAMVSASDHLPVVADLRVFRR